MTQHTFNFTGTVTQYEILDGGEDPFNGSIVAGMPLSGSLTFASPAEDYQPDNTSYYYFAGGDFGIRLQIDSNEFVFHDLHIFVDSGMYGFNNFIFEFYPDKLSCHMENVGVDFVDGEVPTSPPEIRPDTRFHTELSGQRIINGYQHRFKVRFNLDAITQANSRPSSPQLSIP